MDRSKRVKISTESLVNRCLRNLANNFLQEDPKKLELMPKNLKVIFLRIISKRGYITDDNIELFIDADTKELELSECLSLTNSALFKLNVCSNLRKLDLNSNYEPRPAINTKGLCEVSKNCRFLQTILLRRCVNIEDEAIRSLAQNCKLLQNLNIGNCPLITDQALVAIGEACKNIQSINMSGTKVTDFGVYSLMTQTVACKIEEVHLANCDLITDESIEYILMQSKSIKYLMFHGCKQTTDASRLALEEYMANSTNQNIKHLTWTIY